MFTNLILDTDSYKSSHPQQYPPGTTKLFSYVESRGGKYDKTVFFGLQYILSVLNKGVTVADVAEAKAFFEAHGEPFPYEGWLYIATELNGRIPLRIRAVPEGTVVPTSNVLMTVESMDPKVPWVVSWFETMLLRVWYPITVATQSWHIKRVIEHFMLQTAGHTEGIEFKLHDFGSRGVSSQESAAIGGAAHLVNFMGSDTVVGVHLANTVYKAGMAAFSIPAAEHSSITSWGKENEVAAYRNMLQQFGGEGKILAVVSDSYDLYNACENLWGGELRQEVIDSGALLVIRPDSGHPATVVTECLQILDRKFGSTLNAKGYKVLNNVRVIQGDGINQESIIEILETASAAGFSAENVTFGMGGALLQQVNRDTQRFAYKCSWAEVNGKGVDVFKDPVTDSGKKSKRGLIDLVRINGELHTVARTPDQSHGFGPSELMTVYDYLDTDSDFQMVNFTENTFDKVRARANETRATIGV